MALVWTRWIRGLRTVMPRPNGRSRRTNWPASCRCLRRGGLGLSAPPFVPVGPSTGSMISPASIGGSWPSLRRWSSLKTGCSLVAHLTPSRRSCGMKPKRSGTRMPSLLGPSWNRFHPRPFYQIRDRRKSLGIVPVYKLVDTCARAEFEAATPYYYSTYEAHTEPLKVASAPPSVKPRHGPGKGHHSWWWSQPHWPRHRVRLLLRSGLVCRR